MRLQIPGRLESARMKLREVQQAGYLDTLAGTIDADPLQPYRVSDEATGFRRQAA